MSRIVIRLAAGGLIALGLAGAALAHHAGAMFDLGKSVTITGTVKEFVWTNPHSNIWVYVNPKPGAAAEPEVWWVELTSPGNLMRAGWSKRSMKPGDRVAVAIHPLKDGRHGGSLDKVTLLDSGQVLSVSLGAAPPEK